MAPIITTEVYLALMEVFRKSATREELNELMSNALVRCVRCDARKYEGEVVWNTSLKDFVCRDEVQCSKKNKDIGKAKRDRKGRNHTNYARHDKRTGNSSC